MNGLALDIHDIKVKNFRLYSVYDCGLLQKMSTKTPNQNAGGSTGAKMELEFVRLPLLLNGHTL